MSPRRQRALLFSTLALLAVSGAACSAILGLDPPTLAPCADGCADANAPLPDVGAPGVDSTVGDSNPTVVDSGPPEAGVPDAAPDAEEDIDASGVRCGPTGTTLYCSDPSAICCLTLSGGDTASYACAASTNDCSGYSIACASDNDCKGTDVCCFYSSAIKCEPEDTSSCASSMLCDPGVPAADQCNEGQSCVPNVFNENGFTLPYAGCM